MCATGFEFIGGWYSACWMYVWMYLRLVCAEAVVWRGRELRRVRGKKEASGWWRLRPPIHVPHGAKVPAGSHGSIQPVRLTVPFTLFAEVLQVSTSLYVRQLHDLFMIRLSSCTEMLSGWQSSYLHFYAV